MARKSFNEKLQDNQDLPRIVVLTDPKAIRRYKGARMLIAPALFYDQVMRRVPEGRLLTSDDIRSHLARQQGADFTCPLTAGIFINIAANASAERGFDEIPWWRTLRKGGELNEKYPGGITAQQARLEAEGHTIIQKGKKAFVAHYEASLFKLD